MAVAVLAAVVLPTRGAAAASPCPNGQPCVAVTVHGPDGDQLHVLTVTALEDAPGLIPSASYTTRSAGGRESSDTYPDVLPVRSLLALLAIPVDAVVSTSTTDRIGRAWTLSAGDLADPTAAGFPFADGAMPAVYYGGAGAMGYLRPLRGPNDVNDREVFQELDAAAVPIDVYLTGHLLAPTVHAARTKTTTTSPVSFDVEFATPPGTTVTSYAWDFGDGQTSTRARPSHTFTTGGTFAVTVAVTGQDGSHGQSKPVPVVVGVPPKPTHGPKRPGGGTSTATPAPATGPRHGSGGRGGSGTTGDGGTGTGGATGTGTAAQPTAAPTPSPSPSPQPSTSPSPKPSPKPSPRPSPSRPTRTPDPQPRPTAATLPQVEGVLLAGASVSPARGTAASSPRASAPAQRRAGTSGVPAAALGAAAVLLLLVAGAWGELRPLPSAGAGARRLLRRRSHR